MTLDELWANDELGPPLGTTSFTMPALTRAWYNKVYLSVAEPRILHDKWATQTTLAKHSGKTVVWRRWLKLAVSAIPLGTVAPAGKNMAYENVQGTVQWYGDWVGLDDEVNFVHVDNVLSQTTRMLGIQSAETLDIVSRDKFNAGTSYLRVTADGAAPTTGVGARVTVAGTVTKRSLDTAITMLEAADIAYITPKMDGSTKYDSQPIGPAYVAIIHPHVAHDLVSTLSGLGTAFTPVEKYASGGMFHPGEIGKYRNVRFVVTTLAKYWADEGAAAGSSGAIGTTAAAVYRSTAGTGGDVYSVLIFGKGAFGTVKLQGASATYYDPAGGNSDPMHMHCTCAWKAAKTAVILDDAAAVRLECLASW